MWRVRCRSVAVLASDVEHATVGVVGEIGEGPVIHGGAFTYAKHN
jgi:hypothetical protein